MVPEDGLPPGHGVVERRDHGHLQLGSAATQNWLRTLRMTQSRVWRFAAACCAMVVGVLCAGCGGGTTGEVSPPPPSPDFALSISPSSTTVNQGTTSAGIQVGVQSLNGFSGDVQMTLSGMPSGVSANPQSPFTLSSGSSTTLLIGA